MSNRIVENLENAITDWVQDQPVSVLVGQILFTWLGDLWVVVDVEGRRFFGEYEKLSVVKIPSLLLPSETLDCVAVAKDESTDSFIVDELEVEALFEEYGDQLDVLWDQTNAEFSWEDLENERVTLAVDTPLLKVSTDPITESEFEEDDQDWEIVADDDWVEAYWIE